MRLEDGLRRGRHGDLQISHVTLWRFLQRVGRRGGSGSGGRVTGWDGRDGRRRRDGVRRRHWR